MAGGIGDRGDLDGRRGDRGDLDGRRGDRGDLDGRRGDLDGRGGRGHREHREHREYRGGSSRGSSRYRGSDDTGLRHPRYSSMSERRQNMGYDDDLRSESLGDKSDILKHRQHKDMTRGGFSEDSRISKQLRRLSREDDAERYLTQVQQLQESIMLSENIKYVRRNSDHILDSLYESLHAAPSPSCRWEITRCVGKVGHVMEADIKRFMDLTLERLETWRSPEMKVLVLRCILEVLQLDKPGTQITVVGLQIVKGLQGVLEVTETPEVMVATVDVLRCLHAAHNTLLQPYFQDIVDILVGWHIDHHQPVEVMKYVSLALVSFNQLWQNNASIATTLLQQFVEDCDDYVEDIEREVASGASGESTSERSMDLSVCAKKVAAFINVFTTVLKGLGPNAEPSLNKTLPLDFLESSLRKMIAGVKKIFTHHYEEELFNSLNQLCLELMSYCHSSPNLLQHFSEVIEFEESLIEKTSFSTILSYLALLTQMLKQIGNSLPIEFIQKLLGQDAPLRALRISPQRYVWKSALGVYHAALGLKNVGLLQEAYKYILEDLQIAHKKLLPELKDFSTTKLLDGVKYNKEEAKVIVMYYMNVVAEMANTPNSIISMYALNPALVDLLATHLTPASPELALHHPQVQHTILFLLNSHCSKYSHYVSSSSLVVGIPTSFIPTSSSSFSGSAHGFSSGSSTSENLTTILTTITAVLKQRQVTGTNTLKLCIDWAGDVVRSGEKSLLQLQKQPVFIAMIDAVIQTGYHHLASVKTSVATCLSSIFKFISGAQLPCLEEVVMLSLHHISHNDYEIRNNFMELLVHLPLSSVSNELFNAYKEEVNEFSGGKGDPSNSVELGSLDKSSVKTLERHFVLRSTNGQLPAHAFHSLMGFILHCTEPKGEYWQEDLLTISQRIEKMNKVEDWTFPVLASHLRTLLWKWLAWEPAQHCIANKLRTTLGKPLDTFTSIEVVIKKRAKEVREIGQSSKESTLKSDEESGSKEDFRTKDDVSDQTQSLTVILLVEFLESLEKAMFNASDGCAVAVAPPNKSVRAFFRTNRQTCTEWLSRIRAAVIVVALNCGQPEVAVRHSYKLLQELKDNNNTVSGDFERAVCYCARSLVAVENEEAMSGLYHWCKKHIGRHFVWIKPAIYSSSNKYEKALRGYLQYLEGDVEEVGNSETNEDVGIEAPHVGTEGKTSKTSSIDPLVQEFVNTQISQCYSKLSQWGELQKWILQVRAKEKEGEGSPGGLLHTYQDLSHVQALAYFDSADPVGVLTSLEDRVSSIDWNTSHDWIIGKRIQDMNSIILHSFTSAVYPQDSTNRDTIIKVVSECQDQLDWLFQLVTLSAHPSLYIQVILLHQVLNELHNVLGENTEQGRGMQEGWENINLASFPADLVPHVSRWSKLIARVNQNVTPASITKLDMISAKQARKQENYDFVERTLIGLLGGVGSSLSEAVPEVVDSAAFTPLDAKLYREAAKMLSCRGNIERACQVLSVVVIGLNPRLAALATNDPSLLALPHNEAGQLCARSVLTLYKWWGQDDKRSFMLPLEGSVEKVPQWMEKLVTVYEEMQQFAPKELSELAAVSHPALSVWEAHMGQLLTLATTQCPKLPKVWFHVASWCFRWGRKIFENKSGPERQISEEDKLKVFEILVPVLGGDSVEAQEKLTQVCSLLTNQRLNVLDVEGEQIEDDDLRLEEVQTSAQLGVQISSLLGSWGIASTVIAEISPQLIQLSKTVQKRMYVILTCAAQSYFRFLKISHENLSTDLHHNTVATLRLLRLLVKHAAELREVLETGLADTPTRPWKTIIPQLFARLNHPEPYVRGSISELLCRLAEDCPHLIIFPAVVGSAGGSGPANQASLTDMLAKYLHKTRARRKGKEVIEDEDEEDDDDEEEDEEEEDEEEFDPDEEQEEEEDNEVEEAIIESSEEQERRILMRNCFSALVDTLSNQSGSSINDVQTLVHELRRITVLWDELWLGTLAQNHSDMSRKCHQLTAEIARLNVNTSLSQTEKTQLIKKKYDIIFKPLLFILDQLADITTAPPETLHERHFHETYGSQISSALTSLREPESYFEPQVAIAGLRQLEQILQQRAHRRAAFTLKMADVSPKLSALTSTKIAMPGVVSATQQVVTIASVDSNITILPTKTKPKKLSFQGSDGKKYTYLFKGLEDLHLDERIMQFLEIVNTMLVKTQKGRGSVYRARYYSVVPLGPRSGLIQWVGSATPLFGLYKRWQQREAHAHLLKTHASNMHLHPQQPPQVPRPSELYYSKLTPRLREAGISIDKRREWPVTILRDVLKDLVKETPSDLLARELWMCSVNAADWWRITQSYSISTAVMSVIGYIIGLGDRHLDNVLVNLTTGEVVHIDYNVCFEKGKNLRVPEKVPYRMTQNIEGALGVTGTEGVFRNACEEVLRTMRRGRETLLTLLEAFIYDPLVDWTPDSEAGFAGAVYGGDQALVSGARQSRQQLEKGLTLSMFSVRIAEMKSEWLMNKEKVLLSLPEVEEILGTWLQWHQALAQAEEKLQDGHHLMAMLKEAEANQQHTLYGLYPRYKDYALVKKSMDSAKELIASRILEVQTWHSHYMRAAQVFEGRQAGEWRAKVSNLGSLTASVAPVVEFLSQAGQGQMAQQCEQTEVELRKVISRLQGIAGTSLDLLIKYGGIWVNYPADHLTIHRLSQQLSWLISLQHDFSLNNVQSVINTSHREAPHTGNITQICNIDMQLHNKELQVNQQIQKVYEKMRSEGLNDGALVVNAVQETSAGLAALVTEHNIAGVAAMTCALLSSLTQLTSARLRADKTAARAGEGLVDMTVGGLWWLRESMVTLGGMVELVTLLTRHSPPTYPQETPVIQAMSALHDVFGALHELVLNTSGIIIVEGVRLFWRGEPSVLNLATELQGVLASTGIPPATLCQQLQQHLRLLILMMPSPHQSALQEAQALHSNLMEVIERITSGSDNSSGEMSQGQMLLMGFHLLFEAVEAQLDQLIDALTLAPLPQPWPKVDTVREAAEIMAPLQDVNLREVLRLLLRVKKVQTIVEFFSTAYQSSPAARDDCGTNGGLCEEDQLQRIVRCYASDCVSLLLLGLPSHLATHLLLLHCQKVGVNITGYIEARDIGTDARVSLESIVQEGLERCMTCHALDPALPASASTTLTLHLNAVRKKLLYRQWEGEAEGLRTTQQRVSAQHLSHQWYYEDVLKQRTVAPSILPTRVALLADVRTNVSTILALQQNVTELREKYTNFTANVQQRLKWGAGSNPAIALALEEFTGGVEVGLSGVSELLHRCEEVVSLCNTVLHYEALRTHTMDAVTWDTSFTSVLNSCQESCMLVDRYQATISPQEEMLLALSPLTVDVNAQWIQNASRAVSDHIESLTKLLSEQSLGIKTSSSTVRSSVISLRTKLTTHHKLMSDIRTLLKTMAKFEGEGSLAGIDSYLALYRNYSESISGIIRQILCDPLTPDKVAIYTQKLQEVAVQTSIIYDQLLEFGNKCVGTEDQLEGESQRESSIEPRGVTGVRPPLRRQSSVIMSPAKTATPEEHTKIKRHPLTGKVVQEHNAYALNVWRRVKVKLEGRDLDPNKKATVAEQVDYTIKEATNIDNLATLYEGWTSWV